MYTVEQINDDVIKLTSYEMSFYATKRVVSYVDLKNMLRSAGTTYYTGTPPKGYKKPHNDHNVCISPIYDSELGWIIKHCLPKIEKPFGYVENLINNPTDMAKVFRYTIQQIKQTDSLGGLI